MKLTQRAFDAAIIDLGGTLVDTLGWLCRDYGDMVIHHGMPPPPAILYLRQEAYPPEKPAELVLAMMALHERVEGCLVVVTARNARYRRFVALSEA